MWLETDSKWFQKLSLMTSLYLLTAWNNWCLRLFAQAVEYRRSKMWLPMVEYNYLYACPFQCGSVTLPKEGFISSLLDSGCGHVISFGKWVISRWDASRSFQTACILESTPLAVLWEVFHYCVNKPGLAFWRLRHLIGRDSIPAIPKSSRHLSDTNLNHSASDKLP